MKDRNNSTSKFISLILRHKPEVIGITLDEHGWANVDELIAGVNRTRPLDLAGMHLIDSGPAVPVAHLEGGFIVAGEVDVEAGLRNQALGLDGFHILFLRLHTITV